MLTGFWPQEKQRPIPPEPPHVCEEFTRWTNRTNNIRIVAHDYVALPEEKQYEVARYWQERSCTICGKIEQRALALPVDEDENEDADD